MGHKKIESKDNKKKNLGLKNQVIKQKSEEDYIDVVDMVFQS